MSMKIYNAQLSPYSARVRLAVYAKGLDAEIIDAFSTPELEAEFEKLGPLQKVPLLVMDGKVMPESEVICEYFEDLGLGPSLRPEGAENLARMRLLSRIGDLYVMEPMTKLFNQINPKGRDQALVDRELGELAKGIKALAFYLDGSPYAIGGQMTLADCTLAPMLFFYEQIGPMFGAADPFMDVPMLGAYYRGLKNDPHVTRVIVELDAALRKVMSAKPV
ncbi:MAG: glutathione S-transferase family protein [Parvibaculum sp.]|uniref:glutathione S-transferase family protein n=1 Tax=Parvibaculum sp. TaxID=2024848 RepID=UPI0025F7D175|nr:glutathione S-transferase family protein [Parvibaculum sp.]MCE9648681.1 glutathione S-transferase family protein [Parvibaculum sp.]